MLLYAYLNFADFLISLLLAVLVALKGKDRKIVLPFVCWTISISLWSLGVGMHTLSDLNNNYVGAVYWSRILHYGAVPIPIFYLHFVMNYCAKKSNRILVPLYIAFASFLTYIPSKLFISEFSPVISFNYFPKIGTIYPLFVILFVFCVLYSQYLLLLTLKKSSGLRKNQLLYVLLGSLIGYTLGSTAFFPMFSLPIFPFGTPFVILNAVLITYAMIRFKAMDFNLIIRWGLAYGTLFIIIAGLFLGLVIITENFLQISFKIVKGLPTLIAACIVVLIFDPTRKKISKFVDKFIFKSPDFQNSLVGINKELKGTKSADSLIEGLITQFKNIWNVDHAGLAIWDTKESKYKLFPEKTFEKQIISNLNENIYSTDFLVRTLESERRLFKYGIVVDLELQALSNRAMPGEKTTFSKVRRSLRWIGAEVCVPLMIEKQLIGFIILGPKKNKTFYNEEDKKFLSHVSETVTNILKTSVLSHSEIKMAT